ncbi:hypothetical protein Desaci_3267 [Desulfosporosinus acidiphilus SJ4]|uniref:Cytochrome b/b6 N-terminal region profile domain-containing protein n=1 Tax=Desulfosporosinus acidiphilus (strain DSM 22704 / JCM 16185 / SJ4) TaxID=646529 RepID=I4D8N9_DESAJ|nr:cytochrome b N-terminal domain-containing protein [Desulfosporosinus acidiphilus]AFM42163.1 hypothetical protein Desaci_3267 [Desulfosporosinus acidiphilus SJ4]
MRELSATQTMVQKPVQTSDHDLKQKQPAPEGSARNSRHSFVDHLRPRSIPERALSVFYTFCLGGLSFLAFLMLGVTGLLLMFHYQPGESTGYSSVLTLGSVIPYGGIIRNLHYWSAQLMVVTVNLHMVRVVWTHSYKPPKQLNWLVGVGLLVLVLVLDFTGYLLIGSQESGAAATVAANILKQIPVLGTALAHIALGEPTALSGSTLVVYVWHCVALPFAALWLQLYHFWRIRRDGGVRPL